MPSGPRVVELFAGCGGLASGLSQAGFEHAALVELEKHACASLRTNASLAGWSVDAIHECDVNEFDLAPWRGIDLCAAGVPCQPFSHGGLGNGHEDERNLFPALLRAVRTLRPRVILVENVFGLLRPAFEPYFEYILKQLRVPDLAPLPSEDWRAHCERIDSELASSEGEYVVDYKALEAADYGTAQRRRRVFIIAVSRAVATTVPWPTPSHSGEALKWEQATGGYWARHGIERADITELPRPTPLLPWRTVRDAILDLGDPTLPAASDSSHHQFVPGARTYDGHTGSQLDSPAKTIKAGVHGVAGGEAMFRDEEERLRYFTVRETARLQDFDDCYTFPESRTRAMRQLGNAVPVRLARALGDELVRVLAEGHGQ